MFNGGFSKRAPAPAGGDGLAQRLLLLVVVDDLEVGVDDVGLLGGLGFGGRVGLGGRGARRAPAAAWAACACW
jgi:hypothetical protein